MMMMIMIYPTYIYVSGLLISKKNLTLAAAYFNIFIEYFDKLIKRKLEQSISML